MSAPTDVGGYPRPSSRGREDALTRSAESRPLTPCQRRLTSAGYPPLRSRGREDALTRSVEPRPLTPCQRRLTSAATPLSIAADVRTR